jgi:hypothetical protein
MQGGCEENPRGIFGARRSPDVFSAVGVSNKNLKKFWQKNYAFRQALFVRNQGFIL